MYKIKCACIESHQNVFWHKKIGLTSKSDQFSLVNEPVLLRSVTVTMLYDNVAWPLVGLPAF